MTAKEIIEYRQRLGLELYNITEVEWKSIILNELKDDGGFHKVIKVLKNQQWYFDEERLKKIYVKMFYDAGPPTDLQPGYQYQLVKELLEKSIYYAKQLNVWNGEEPVIATEFGKSINGFCFEADNGEVGVVLDSTLLTFANQLAKLIAPVIFIIEENEIRVANSKEIEHATSGDSEFYRNFTDLFVSYMTTGTTNASKPFSLESRYIPIVSGMRDGIELFIVSHECGHIYHKHFRDKWMKGGNDPENLTYMVEVDMPVFRYRQHRELDADIFGYSVVWLAAEVENDPLLALGPILYFVALDILERFLFFGLIKRNLWEEYDDAVGYITAQAFIPNTHPKPIIRNATLLRALKNKGLPPQIMGLIEHFEKTVQLIFLSSEKEWQKKTKSSSNEIFVHERWYKYKEEFEYYNIIGKSMRERKEGDESIKGHDDISSVAKGDLFEDKVFNLLSGELKSERLYVTAQNSRIFAKKPYYSRDRSSDIVVDISIETSVPGANSYSLLTLVECKNYSHPVPVSDIEEFHSKVQQVSGDNVKAIFITNSSLQKGALSFAQAKKIAVIRILPADKINWVLFHLSDDAITELARPNLKEFHSAFFNQDHEGINLGFYGLNENIMFTNLSSLLQHFYEDQ